MFSLENLNLRNRILLGYAVPLSLTLAATGLVILSSQKLQHQDQATDRGWLIVQQSDRLALAMWERQANARGYLLTGDEAFSKAYADSVENYNQIAKKLETLIDESTPEQQQRLQKAMSLGKDISQINFQLIDLGKSGKIKQAIGQFSQGKILSLLTEVKQILTELNQEEDRLQAERQKDKQAALRSLITLMIGGAIAATVLAIAIGLWIASRITEKINNTVSAIASSSTEIAATVNQQELTARTQAAAVSQTSSTMNELAFSSRQSAEQADAAANGVRQVLALVDGNMQTDRQILQGSASLRDAMGQISQQIIGLSEQVSQINSIINLVSNLANQTNMLAINAAVEAVRAGDKGKGFAVVANEIRKLADQSRKSAERITVLVGDIQNSTNTTVMVTERGSNTVSGIVEAINSIATNSQQISLTAQQQANAIQQVLQAMSNINQGAVQTASGIAQTKETTQKLNEAALNLKTIV